MNDFLIGFSALTSIYLGVFAFKQLKLKNLFNSILIKTLESAAVLLDKSIGDETKERIIRREALTIIYSSLKFTLLFFVLAFTSIIPLYLIYYLGLIELNELIQFLLSKELMILSIIVLIILWKTKKKPANNARLTGIYSPSEKLIHNFCFYSPQVLKHLAKLDNVIFPGLSKKVGEPIFIIGLPRSGSTALLNALFSFPCVGTFTYQNMPFITMPGFTKHVLSKFRVRLPIVERYHGDGHKISINSPEAFDETLWKIFFSNSFTGDVIEAINPEINSTKFRSFFSKQINRATNACIDEKDKKIPQEKRRYCSKNNANISRLPILQKLFPKGKFVGIVREPLPQASSLHQQHQKFINLQSKDKFIKKYMDDLGHLEFGKGHKPLHLIKDKTIFGKPSSPNYWLNYWINVYGSLLEEKANIYIIFLEDLCKAPNTEINKLMVYLELSNQEQDWSVYFKDSNITVTSLDFKKELIIKAEYIYQSLKEKQNIMWKTN